MNVINLEKINKSSTSNTKYLNNCSTLFWIGNYQTLPFQQDRRQTDRKRHFLNVTLHLSLVVWLQ